MYDGDRGDAKVAIIGASGFVGAGIIRAALASTAVLPVACMRRPSRELEALGVATALCDATDAIALGRALDGATHAVNCVLGSPATMVTATRNLCAAARQQGLRRIVHMSSMAVYGPMTGVVDETACLQPAGSYGRAKAECEKIVRDFIAAGGDAVVLRPGCVYGPGGQQWVGRIARWLQAGRLGDLGEWAEGFCNLSFIDDLAGAVLAALMTREAAGQTFNIAERDPGTWNQYFVELGREIGVSVRRVSHFRISLETCVLAPPLQIAKIVGQRFGVRPGLIPEPIPPSLPPLWRQRIRLDHRTADAALAFQRTPRRRGLTLCASWFHSAATGR